MPAAFSSAWISGSFASMSRVPVSSSELYLAMTALQAAHSASTSALLKVKAPRVDTRASL